MKLFHSLVIIIILTSALKMTLWAGPLNLLLRGVAGFIGFAIGLPYVIARQNFFIRKHLVLSIYIISLLLSIIQAQQKMYCLLQVVSLIAVIIFFIAYTNNLSSESKDSKFFFNTFLIIIGTFCLLSLLLYLISPSTVNYLVGRTMRFRGIFYRPGTMSVMSGLYCGIAIFGKYKNIVKIPAAAIGAVCLFLPLSRTYWIAFIVSSMTTYLLYVRKSASMMKVSITVYVVVLILMMVNVSHFSIEKEEIYSLARLDSAKTLSGRYDIWGHAFKQGYDKIFGYGFGSGGSALGVEWEKKRQQILLIGDKTKLHNGFVQSFCDIGLIGTLFYCLIVLSPLLLLLKNDKERRFKVEFFCVLYLILTNFGESSIHTSAQLHTLIFYFIYIYLQERLAG